MALFFKSEPDAPRVKDVIVEALSLQPPPAADRDKLAAQMIRKAKPEKLAWERVIAAVVFLGIIFAMGIYTSQHKELEDWGKTLLHTFDVVLGGLGATILGEAAKKD